MSIHQLTVQLPHFEGPLGLLLYLIRKEEMDIMDIKIHEITAQYLDYIKMMKELDVEVAGEFIAMAATLIHIKSRMLLPQYGENGEIIEQDDPRKELVQKLMEYQKYQEAAKLLAERPWVGRDVFLRGARERLDVEDDSIELEDNALFSLIGAYRRTVRALNKRVHKVAAKAQSIASRIVEIRDRLVVGVRIAMNEIIGGAENRGRATLITFLSLLELGRMGFVSLTQNEPYSDIWIVAKKTIEDAAISRVEEYDNINASAVADELTTAATIDEADEEIPPVALTDGGEELSLENLLSEPGADLDLGDIATDDEILAAEKEMMNADAGETPAATTPPEEDNTNEQEA